MRWASFLTAPFALRLLHLIFVPYILIVEILSSSSFVAFQVTSLPVWWLLLSVTASACDHLMTQARRSDENSHFLSGRLCYNPATCAAFSGWPVWKMPTDMELRASIGLTAPGVLLEDVLSHHYGRYTCRECQASVFFFTVHTGTMQQERAEIGRKPGGKLGKRPVLSTIGNAVCHALPPCHQLSF